MLFVLLLSFFLLLLLFFFFFFFNDTATTEIYTLSLHDALPILPCFWKYLATMLCGALAANAFRSEEHTSELQSHHDIVCRLLLEKKKKNKYQSAMKKHQPKSKIYTSDNTHT